jgi:hypothetical protein
MTRERELSVGEDTRDYNVILFINSGDDSNSGAATDLFYPHNASLEEIRAYVRAMLKRGEIRIVRRPPGEGLKMVETVAKVVGV